jgi:hypothetical protein
MDMTSIIAQIDKQIALLQSAKSILLGTEPKAKAGRPKVSKKAPKRTMSAEGRARIAAAQKARWAAAKKTKK